MYMGVHELPKDASTCTAMTLLINCINCVMADRLMSVSMPGWVGGWVGACVRACIHDQA